MSSDGGNRHDSDFAGTLLGNEPQDEPPYGDRPTVVRRRGDRHRRSRRTRRRIVTLVCALIVVAMVVGGYVFVRSVFDGFGAKNYSGPGTGSVIVQVKAGDGADEIGTTLRSNDVVASQRAFIDAARSSGHSDDFQPGFFRLRKQMSAGQAVDLLLDPTARVSTTVTIPEGTIEPQVLKVLAAQTKLPLAEFTAAAADIANLGIPDGYTARSAEGFLFPQTYEFDPDATALDALQAMTSMYGTEARKLNFSAGAAKVKMTPYQALIIASMIEAEVRFDADRAKVARVVYNRLAQHVNLGFDTTTAYEYRVKGLDPTKATYKENSPYNTRTNPGLPPTPIGNPGEKSMIAAITPATGNWLYFVSQDAAGHLFFTNDYNAFLVATQKCIDKKWGCT